MMGFEQTIDVYCISTDNKWQQNKDVVWHGTNLITTLREETSDKYKPREKDMTCYVKTKDMRDKTI
jgi:hypothetical protein